MKNTTGRKSLDVVNDDARVVSAYRDVDGYWIELAPGWTANPFDAHDVHEDTVAAALSQYRGIVKCACASCTGAAR